MPRWPKYLKRGESITEEWIKALLDTLLMVVRPQAPLRFERSRHGVTLTLESEDFGLAIGVTAETISARSGMTAGHGDVDFLKFSPPTFSAGATARAYSIKPTTVPSGKWVVVAKVYGHWFIIAIVC